MNKKYTYSPVLFILLLFGCQDYSAEVQPLYPTKTIQELGDDFILSDLRIVQAEKENYFFNDWSNSQIIALDKNLNLSHYFGKRGEGPSEFQWVGTLQIANDLIYANDDAGRRIHVFRKNGEFVRTIPLLNIAVNLADLRFTVIDGHLILPASIFSDSDIIIIDQENGELISEVQFNSGDLSTGINVHTVTSYNDQVLAVNRMIPVVRKISLEGELLDEYDLTHIEQLGGLWKHYDANKNQSNFQNYTTIIRDAYADKSHLYILCEPWPGRDNYAYIIKLNLMKEKIDFDRVFKIQGADSSAIFFRSIAVDGNILIAVEGSTMTINTYDLSELK